LLSNQHRKRPADHCADDAAAGRIVLPLPHLRVVAGPMRGSCRAAVRPKVINKVAIRIEHTDRGHRILE
jgi:hypothetical protein